MNGVDLTVSDGEFLVLLGPSGCGKTTILRMIAGLEKVTDGEIWIDGDLVNDEPPDRRNIGMVFQNYALYPHMTVAGNLGFGLEARRRGSRRAARKEERRLIKATAELLEIDHVLSHRPKELSGGQRQRVALGRAIIRQPAIFLMDEPLSNLDASLRERMRVELARLHEKLRITTVYVTHDQSEALTLADRIVVLHEGRTHQVGTASEVYEHPADTVVARFLGSPGMNLWTLPVQETGDTATSRGALALPSGLLPRDGAMATVTVGIRPEHFRLAGAFAADAEDRDRPHGETVLYCRADVLEHMGSHLLMHGSFGDGESVVARLDAKAPVQRGDQLALTASTAHTHLFDAVTGERLDPSTAQREHPVIA